MSGALWGGGNGATASKGCGCGWQGRMQNQNFLKEPGEGLQWGAGAVDTHPSVPLNAEWRHRETSLVLLELRQVTAWEEAQLTRRTELSDDFPWCAQETDTPKALQSA